jgi:hypothetical protein
MRRDRTVTSPGVSKKPGVTTSFRKARATAVTDPAEHKQELLSVLLDG